MTWWQAILVGYTAGFLLAVGVYDEGPEPGIGACILTGGTLITAILLVAAT